MNKLERVSGGSRAIVKFNPKQTRMKLGALKEGVKLAAKIKDWEALEAAIDAVIDEQRAFVGWWMATSHRGEMPNCCRERSPLMPNGMNETCR